MKYPILGLFVFVAIVYAVQAIISVTQLLDGGVLFDKYKSKRDFWFWFAVPIIPILCLILRNLKELKEE